ncbi:MAG: RNA-binding S4 domain-containing protein [Alphaproteobacteria bacterium]
MIATDTALERAPGRAKTRLDQWLWFARFVKSRSLAARLCTAGVVTLNGNPVTKANQAVRIGDIVRLSQGGWQHTVRVIALGVRRGPASEARGLYEEAAASLRLSKAATGWMPLLEAAETDEISSPLS